ncbi:hypothetical protein Tco_0663224 [Tanacetum coccineum]
MASITKKFITKTNATKISRFLATFSDGNPPTPPSLKGLFKVVDVPNPFDENIGMLGSSNPHQVSVTTLKSLADFLSERKQDLGKWASSIADFVSKQDISLPDLETVLDVLDEMGVLYSIEFYEVVSNSNLVIPPHVKERLLNMMRMANVRSSEGTYYSSVKVSEDKVEVYIDAPGFMKENFQIIVERHLVFITGLAVTPTSGTKVINKQFMLDDKFKYDASKVSAVLENGLLRVKLPVGTLETMQAEPFSVPWE